EPGDIGTVPGAVATRRPSKRPLCKAPGRYRSRYCTAARTKIVWFDLVPRRACSNGNFRAARQVQIVATFNEDGTSAGADSDSCANSRAFTATGDCADDGADRAADRRPRYGARGLAVIVLHISLPIPAHPLAVGE